MQSKLFLVCMNPHHPGQNENIQVSSRPAPGLICTYGGDERQRELPPQHRYGLAWQVTGTTTGGSLRLRRGTGGGPHQLVR